MDPDFHRGDGDGVGAGRRSLLSSRAKRGTRETRDPETGGRRGGARAIPSGSWLSPFGFGRDDRRACPLTKGDPTHARPQI